MENNKNHEYTFAGWMLRNKNYKKFRLTVDERLNYRLQTNNWLKFHGKHMRRKPFKRERPLLVDEYCNI